MTGAGSVAAALSALAEKGWAKLPETAELADWAAAAAPIAQRLMAAPDAAYRCDGTWFPGVNILPNGADGGASREGLPPLGGQAVSAALAAMGVASVSWDRAQVSACLPGYPRHGDEETEAAFGYRLRRDAAHVDGLERVMPGRRRKLSETHGAILGIPISGVGPGRSPFVVWEGSHEAMRNALRGALCEAPPAQWRQVDVTEAYQAARAACFDTLARVEIHAEPGEAYLVHRLALHGVAPWTAPQSGPARVVAYFRPDPRPGADPDWWLEAP